MDPTKLGLLTLLGAGELVLDQGKLQAVTFLLQLADLVGQCRVVTLQLLCLPYQRVHVITPALSTPLSRHLVLFSSSLDSFIRMSTKLSELVVLRAGGG